MSELGEFERFKMTKIVSVSKVEYRDSAGTMQTLDPRFMSIGIGPNLENGVPKPPNVVNSLRIKDLHSSNIVLSIRQNHNAII